MTPSHLPVTRQGFCVAHFLTVKDQVKSKQFYAGVLGGKILKEENPCYIKLENSWIILNSGGGPTPDKPAVWLAPPGSRSGEQLPQSSRRRHSCLLQELARERCRVPYPAPRQPRPGIALLHARSRRLPHRGRPVLTTSYRRLQKLPGLIRWLGSPSVV